MDAAINGLFSFQFLGAAIAIFAVMSLIKKGLGVFKKTAVLLDKPWFQAFVLSLLPIAFGMLIALIPDFLKGDDFSHRVIFGICAGFGSQFVYSVVKKRIDPAAPAKPAKAKATAAAVEKPPEDIKKELDK